MNSIQGFFTIPALYNNTADTVAKFGELSPKSATFSRDPRKYTKSDSNVDLNTFRIVNELGQSRTIPIAVSNRIVNLGKWLYQQYELSQVPTQIQATLFAQSIATEHNITNVTLGTISSGTTATKRLPAWIRFNMTETGEDFDVKIWLENAKFFVEYEYKEIFAVAPTPSLSDLQQDLVQLTNVLASGSSLINYADVESQITAVYPKTETVRFPLTWHQPSDPQITRETTWLLIVYGNAGTDNDAIKEAIREYIQNGSSETNWPTIYPELYAENEFSVIPLWNKEAAPPTGGLETIYSPTATMEEIRVLSKQKLPGSYVSNTTTGVSFIANNARFVPTNYRQLGTIICGSPSNTGGITDIRQVFPDLTTISSTSPDYSRMEANTRGLLEQLLEALDVAFSYTITSSIPSGFTRVIRGGRTYISFNYLGYQYLVMTKMSM